MSEHGGTRVGDTRLERRKLITWLWRLPVLAAVAGVGWGAWKAYHVHFDKVQPDTPSFGPITPQHAASLLELKPLWSSVSFTLNLNTNLNAGPDENPTETPALVLHVPEAVAGSVDVGGQHYLAFSRVCTHLGCPVNLNSNLETLAVAFNYRTEHPALACPCHLSIFSPLEAGKAVSGPAREPLPRVQLERRDDALFAVGLERPRS